MVSLIKNQLLKRLSVFTKNLSPDKLQLSTLKGEGNLSDLELDENVLMQVLDLPTWLRLTKAVCNKLSVRIQWTKLKSQPICLYLDEVVVEMETCEDPRNPQTTSPMAGYSAGGHYGFAERIIDGMFLSINSVVVNFKANAFAASFQMSRIVIESKTPTWQKGNLRMTRIKDDARGEILLFKEAEWQTLRIEANALEGSDCDLNTTPLRLIANQSKIRITMKKRLIDCGIVTSRLQVNLDDLLWVLTDSQLKAALVFINSLKDVIKKSSQQSKLHAAEKLKKQTPSPTHGATAQQPKPAQAISQLFTKYDITETSYHLHTGRIDLHLCDDAAPDEEYKRKVEGGALQVTLYKLSLDHYPFHVAGSDRKHWLKFDENMAGHGVWSQSLYEAFKADVGRVRQVFTDSPCSSPSHTGDSKSSGAVQPRVAARLLESCFVVRAEDFVVFRVSTTSDTGRNTPRRFLSSEKKQLLLPPEMSAFHLQYTDYYFPEGVDFPESGQLEELPHANLYVMVNPVRLKVDYLTLVWLNSFVLNLAKQLEFTEDTGSKFHTDIKIDALMPKIIIPARAEVTGQPDRPDGLQIRASRITVTNCRTEPKSSLQELGSTLDMFNGHTLFHTIQFPNHEHDLVANPDVFHKYFSHTDGRYYDKFVEGALLGNAVTVSSSPQNDKSAMPTYFNMRTDSLKTDATKDVWCIHLDQLWMEFVGVASSGNRPVPFTESVPVTLWVTCPCLSKTPSEGDSCNGTTNHVDASQASLSNPNGSAGESLARDRTSAMTPRGRQMGEVHVIVKVDSKLNAQLNHYQLLFLLRLADTLTEHQEEISADVLAIMHDSPKKSNTVLAVILREVEFAMVCPPLPEVHTFASTSREDSSIDDLFTVEDCGKGPSDVTLTCMSKGHVDGSEPAVNVTDSGTEKPNSRICNKTSFDGLHSHSDTDLLPPPSGETASSEAAETIRASHSEAGLGTVNQMHGDSSPDLELPNVLLPDDGFVSLASDADTVQFVSTNCKAVNGSMRQTEKGGSGELKKSFNTAFSNFSKGLSSSYSIISEKMKQNMSKYDEDMMGDEWETLSIKSGASSDDDEFAVLKFQNASELPAFEFKGWCVSESTSVADTASEATDADIGSTGSTIGGQSISPAGVSVVSFILRHVDLVVQARAEDDFILSANVQCLDVIEHGNIGLETFQTKFASDTKISRKTEEWELLDVPLIKMRYQMGPQAELLAETAGKRGYLDCLVQNLHTSMVTSSMANLADLMEDEKIPPFMPMIVRISNSDITLRDDKPPTHMTSPGIVPVDLHIVEMVMRRTQDGVYHITGGSSGDISDSDMMTSQQQQRDDHGVPTSVTAESPSTAAPMDSSQDDHLHAENEKLRLEISVLRSKSENSESETLAVLRAENEQLRKQLEKIIQLNNMGTVTSNSTTNSDNENQQRECKKMTEEQVLQRENAELLEQLVQEQEEVKIMQQERESLLMTIQLLQEELSSSEELRLSLSQASKS